MSQDGRTASESPDVTAEDPLSRLEHLEQTPVHDHVAAFEAVHDVLRARLEGPSRPGGTEA